MAVWSLKAICLFCSECCNVGWCAGSWQARQQELGDPLPHLLQRGRLPLGVGPRHLRGQEGERGLWPYLWPYLWRWDYAAWSLTAGRCAGSDDVLVKYSRGGHTVDWVEIAVLNFRHSPRHSRSWALSSNSWQTININTITNNKHAEPGPMVEFHLQSGWHHRHTASQLLSLFLFNHNYLD